MVDQLNNAGSDQELINARRRLVAFLGLDDWKLLDPNKRLGEIKRGLAQVRARGDEIKELIYGQMFKQAVDLITFYLVLALARRLFTEPVFYRLFPNGLMGRITGDLLDETDIAQLSAGELGKHIEALKTLKTNLQQWTSYARWASRLWLPVGLVLGVYVNNSPLMVSALSATGAAASNVWGDLRSLWRPYDAAAQARLVKEQLRRLVGDELMLHFFDPILGDTAAGTILVVEIKPDSPGVTADNYRYYTRELVRLLRLQGVHVLSHDHTCITLSAEAVIAVNDALQAETRDRFRALRQVSALRQPLLAQLTQITTRIGIHEQWDFQPTRDERDCLHAGFIMALENVSEVECVRFVSLLQDVYQQAEVTHYESSAGQWVVEVKGVDALADSAAMTALQHVPVVQRLPMAVPVPVPVPAPATLETDGEGSEQAYEEPFPGLDPRALMRHAERWGRRAAYWAGRGAYAMDEPVVHTGVWMTGMIPPSRFVAHFDLPEEAFGRDGQRAYKRFLRLCARGRVVRARGESGIVPCAYGEAYKVYGGHGALAQELGIFKLKLVDSKLRVFGRQVDHGDGLVHIHFDGLRQTH